MLITLKDNKNKLVVKDILDIDFDMSVESKKGKYYVVVNSSYRCEEEYEDEDDAIDQMRHIVNVRNRLEAELFRDY